MFLIQRAKALKRLNICAGLTKPSLSPYPLIGFIKALLVSTRKNNDFVAYIAFA